MDIRIGIIGLGYVGLPLALAFARLFKNTVGFDLDHNKISMIRNHQDPTEEGLEAELKETTLTVDNKASILKGCNYIIVGVPTPVDQNRSPDLKPLLGACRSIAEVIKGGEIIIFESTVYPGLTEEICGTEIERLSGLKLGVDFKLGYSPERINPGDKEHTFEKITKVVAGQDGEALEKIAALYGAVVKAGIHRAPSIKVAEAAKVIENTQRDLNIALINELAIIFDKIGIRTKDVLDAAATKWNFLKFSPGLVGGHCIGVDPYYLTTKAQQLGYHPEVILAGRRINDTMGSFIAHKAIKMLASLGFRIKGSKIAVLGLTFKENVSDLRNSKVPDIINELIEYQVQVLVHDPIANSEMANHEYGVKLSSWQELKDLDGIILAVNHRGYTQMPKGELFRGLKPNGIVVDVKSVLKQEQIPQGVMYWSL